METIDELPAVSEATQRDDNRTTVTLVEGNTTATFIDMQEVVGKKDILMLCFDTLRYDVAMEEQRNGGTATLNKYGSGWEKRHSPGNFTYPSHFAIFGGFLPSPAEPHNLKDRRWLFFPYNVGTGREAPKGSYGFRDQTFVQALSKREGYDTICIGGVGFFSKRNAMGRVFPGYFEKSFWTANFGCAEKNSAKHQIDYAIDELSKVEKDKRVMMYINFSAIHYPNCHYIAGKTADDKQSHAAALRYIDGELERLFSAFKKRADTLVVALSDHGSCYGEDGYQYHCISHEVVYTVPYQNFILKK